MHRASTALANGAAQHARRGRVPVWIPPLVCVGLAWWVMALVASDAPQAGYTTVHPARAALRLDKPCDPRWNQLLQAALAELPPADVEDRGALERIGDEIALLPFVEEVGEVRVLWPDSLDIPLRLKTPVACVRLRKELLTVAEDGTLLPGAHDMPPMDDHGFLPVLGPNGAALDRLVPGDKLPAGAHLDALGLALALRAELDPEASLLLGPILIDASEAAQGGVEHPGVVLRLEERRTAWFGRLPGASSGETPLKIKVDNLERAARLLRPGEGSGAGEKPWLFLDLRWDNPDIQYRDAPKADGDKPGAKQSGDGAARRP